MRKSELPAPRRREPREISRVAVIDQNDDITSAASYVQRSEWEAAQQL